MTKASAAFRVYKSSLNIGLKSHFVRSEKVFKMYYNVMHIVVWLCTLLYGGTGMIASSSTFCPHLGRVIRDLNIRLLNAVYGTVRNTSLQQSSKGSCSLLVSDHNLWADCQWRTLVPPLNSGADAAPAGAGVGRGSLK